MERPGEERASTQAREIHRGRRFVVTRTLGSFGARGSRPVIEKTVEPAHHDAEAVAALMHEAAVLRRIEAPGVEKVVALRTVRALPVLVLEDAGTSTLRDRTRRPFEVGAFLDLALRLAEILAHVHGCDVIHRDINPSNIVLDADDSPTLVDFDRAASGSSSVSTASDEGGGALQSLAYASPEQLGRTNRVVDRRSDLYSLGTVLYEMLTGGPPFRADDPLEVIHAHLAKVPVSPTVVAAGVPRPLSGIVLKLLAKMPEARYQTAVALAADLLEARNRWRASGSIEPLRARQPRSRPPSSRCPSASTSASTSWPCCARRSSAPPAAPASSFSSPATPGSARAPSGRAGATRCSLGAEQGCLSRASSTSVESQRALRLANSLEALRGLVVDVAARPDDRRVWRARILAAVADNGRVMTELLPELEVLIGAPPSLAQLDPLEAQTRLYVTLQAFVQAFASEGKPLVVFLDDLHWADAASLDALRALATDPESQHVLLVGAFRPRDVGAGHPLGRLEAELRRARMPASRIDLAPATRKARPEDSFSRF